MLTGNVIQITKTDGDATMAVASTGNVKTQPINIAHAEFFGIWFKAVSASGAASVTVEMEQSWENSSDNDDWVEPSGASDIFTDLTNEIVNVKSFSPVPMPWLRLSITGTGSNPADTIAEGYIFIQSHS